MASPTLHSRFGASNSHRWLNCPGSVAAEAAAPPETGFNMPAIIGTAAHTLLETCLEARGTDQSYPHEHIGEVIHAQGMDITVDEEMAAAVAFARDCILQLELKAFERFGEWPMMHLETRLSLAHIDKEAFGTGDVILYIPGKYLCIFDYKNGKGVPVEIMYDGEPNTQLSYYAVGALKLFDMPHDAVVQVAVCQPHRGGLKLLELSAGDFIDEATKIYLGIQAARAPGAPRVAGDWCRFCRAAGTCKTLAAVAYERAAVQFQPRALDEPPGPPRPVALADPRAMDDALLAQAVSAVPVIEAWCNAITAAATARARTGTVLEGFKLVNSYGHRAWKDEAAVAKAMVEAGLDPDEAVEVTTKLLTPAQFEKKVLAKLPVKQRKAFTDGLTEKPFRGVVLAPADDARPAVQAALPFSPVSLPDEHDPGDVFG